MNVDDIISVLQGAVTDLKVEVVPSVDCPGILVPREQIIATLTALGGIPTLAFGLLSELTAVDWWPAEPRFQVVYNLTSIANRMRMRVKVPLPGQDAHLPTATVLWGGANWLEREVFDLFGIVFDGHPDLRRVLMPDDWEGYPLRKDYPVQITMPVKVYEPLQVSAEEFQRNIEGDRKAREREQTKLTRE